MLIWFQKHNLLLPWLHRHCGCAPTILDLRKKKSILLEKYPLF